MENERQSLHRETIDDLKFQLKKVQAEKQRLKEELDRVSAEENNILQQLGKFSDEQYETDMLALVYQQRHQG